MSPVLLNSYLVAPSGPDVTNTFGAHLYWRIHGSSLGWRQSSGAFNEMAFKDKSGAAISASGGTAIELAHFSTNAVANLFDNNFTTFWESANFVPWAGYQFATPQPVMQMGLAKHSSMNGETVFSDAWIEFSNDGETWFPAGNCHPTIAISSNDTLTYFALPSGGGNFNTARTSFGAHAYWRVCGDEHGFTGTFTALSAMAFKDGSGSTISLSGGSAIESNHFSTFDSSMLFDGNDTTFWESNTLTVPWAGYHFSGAVTVMQIGLQKHASMDGSTPCLVGLFQFSDDGVTWVTAGVADVAAGLTTAGNDVMHYFNLAGAL